MPSARHLLAGARGIVVVLRGRSFGLRPSSPSFLVLLSSFAASALRSSYCLNASAVKELAAGLHLVRGRPAPEHQPVRLLDARRVVRLVGDALGEPLGVLLHEVAVHEEQPLQRDVGREALLGGLARAREVEQLQELVELVAAHAAVDRAARAERRQRRRTARPCACRARRRRTAPSRGSARRVRRRRFGAPVEPVAAVLGEVGCIVVRAQLIDGAPHDLAVQRLDRDAVRRRKYCAR